MATPVTARPTMTHDQEALGATRLTESDLEMAEASKISLIKIRRIPCHRLSCATFQVACTSACFRFRVAFRHFWFPFCLFFQCLELR